MCWVKSQPPLLNGLRPVSSTCAGISGAPALWCPCLSAVTWSPCPPVGSLGHTKAAIALWSQCFLSGWTCFEDQRSLLCCEAWLKVSHPSGKGWYEVSFILCLHAGEWSSEKRRKSVYWGIKKAKQTNSPSFNTFADSLSLRHSSCLLMEWVF